MGDRAMNDMVPGDTTAGQNATGGNRRKSYSGVVTEGMRRIARAFVGDSRVRKTGRALKTTWCFALQRKQWRLSQRG